jgi:hypothetical protein
MKLELSEEDVRLLRHALNRQVLMLRDELAHTDDREYRLDLRRELDRLEKIEEQLSISPTRKLHSAS